ncbi:MAG: DUF5979 domain-containing protein [Hespellia sp.]|nr:DUF5979 domain-containing protein [Hespellia sp.]
MMKKRGRIGSALLLALVLVASVVGVPKVQAANAVDVDADCSIDFTIAGSQTAGALKELYDGTVSVPVKMYKVASIDASGNYMAESEFSKLGVESVNSETSAADWSEKAETAAKIVADNGMTTDITATIKNGMASIQDLKPGLYLVDAENAMSPSFEYSFTPYLVSLPNNYYNVASGSSSDEWIYHLTGENALSLKPEQTARFGSLVINKTLVNQNITMGESASFVFEAVITPLVGETYKKQAMITMNSAGNDSVTIEKIPAGATVTVTEIYSGASYEVSEVDGQTVLIPANGSASVAFTNTHDGRPNGGHGVENSFRLDENNQYQWYQDGAAQ